MKRTATVDIGILYKSYLRSMISVCVCTVDPLWRSHSHLLLYYVAECRHTPQNASERSAPFSAADQFVVVVNNTLTSLTLAAILLASEGYL